ncbi:hypothetical protein EJB05_31854 [Eragrostis curvula]|uniref:Uncharacterized protein n=1 Tax=Eragrostis curvula TaxID=38414 RepID=A0A5J9UEN7_9POAL|nr:hypothetical protein EJB05_31854 [Eragrostis curvula]
MEKLVNDSVDSVLDYEDNKVLSTIARRLHLSSGCCSDVEKMKQPSTPEPSERTAIAEAVDKNEDNKELDR